MNLLAVDPSLRSCGVALFRDGTLTDALCIKPTRAAIRLSPAQRAWDVSQKIVKGFALEGIQSLVVEWPQVYRATRSKGNPNDLLGLAAIAGILVAFVDTGRVQTPTPAEWIGQLPKSTKGDPRSSPRGARIWSRLSEDERSLVPLQHDAFDAVGLGLWSLGRLSPRKSYEVSDR